jgi:DNA helicase IV
MTPPRSCSRCVGSVWSRSSRPRSPGRGASRSCVAEAQEKRRWFTTEETDRLRAARPEQQLGQRVRDAGCDTLLTREEQLAVKLVDGDLDQAVDALNERFVEAELDACARFFETIEKSPLTAEQARAVVTFDNRVQLLAAAGSGKTSVMVARAAYAVSRGLVPPDRILLLAFNRNAAAELQERIQTRFAEAGIDATGVTASTFHRFGLNLIGQATGKKPRPASWLENGEDVRTVVEIVDQLRDSSETFRYRWDLYRMLFANAPGDLDEGEPDAYDRDTRETGYRTFSGTMVKSHGERLIADFLYLNGIAFEYEKPYDVDVASETHAQYRPDFYYPDVDAWHEHWALDREGNPPAEFEGYAEGIRWKRHLHDAHGTTLVETTWADVVYGEGLRHLQERLRNLGVSFDWNPDRPVNDDWAKPMKHEELARFVRTFMTHVKSNSWTRDDLERRLDGDCRHLRGFRTGCSSTSTGRSTRSGTDDWRPTAASTSKTCSCRPPITSKLVASTPRTSSSWWTSSRTPAGRAPGSSAGWYVGPDGSCSPSATTGSPSTGSPAPTCR